MQNRRRRFVVNNSVHGGDRGWGQCRNGRGGLAEVAKGNDGSRNHEHQRKDGNDVTRRSAPGNGERRGGKSRQGCTLPQEMKQRQSERAQDVRRKPVNEDTHESFLSYSSSKRRSEEH